MYRFIFVIALTSGSAAAQVTCQTANGITRCNQPGQSDQLICQTSLGITRCSKSTPTFTAPARVYSAPIHNNDPPEIYTPRRASERQPYGPWNPFPAMQNSQINQQTIQNANRGQGIAQPTSQRQTPTDVELKASYCVGVIRAEQDSLFPLFERISDTSETRRQFAAQTKSDMYNKLKRLTSYIEPRMQYVQLPPLLAALQQGRDDWSNQESAALPNLCLAKCGVGEASANNTAQSKEVDKCYSACTSEDGLSNRIASCNDQSFLPY